MNIFVLSLISTTTFAQGLFKYTEGGPFCRYLEGGEFELGLEACFFRRDWNLADDSAQPIEANAELFQVKMSLGDWGNPVINRTAGITLARYKHRVSSLSQDFSSQLSADTYLDVKFGEFNHTRRAHSNDTAQNEDRIAYSIGFAPHISLRNDRGHGISLIPFISQGFLISKNYITDNREATLSNEKIEGFIVPIGITVQLQTSFGTFEWEIQHEQFDDTTETPDVRARDYQALRFKRKIENVGVTLEISDLKNRLIKEKAAALFFVYSFGSK